MAEPTITPSVPSIAPPVESTPRWAAAVSGVVAAGIALAVGEVPSALTGESQSLVTTVGNQFIDSFAAGLKEFAVAVFGTSDKVALVTGIVAVSLVLGAGLGVAARARPWIGTAGFAGFGALGMAAALTDPQAHTGAAATGPVLATAAGVASLRLLLRRAGAGRRAPWREPNTDPARRTPDRRSFLAFAGVGATGAVAVAVAGRSLRAARLPAIDTTGLAAQLPSPVRSVPIPVTGVDVPGVSAYLTPNADFYRIDTALSVPRVDPSRWALRVHGLVDAPFQLSYADLLAMDMVETPVTLQCVSNLVGGDLVGTANWLGVPLVTLLERAGVQDAGTQIVGRSVDGFTVGFPTSAAFDGRTALVAVGMNGELLPTRHGFPARLVVAGLYGYVSATKWLSDIELTRFEDFDAYWVPRGWAKVAPIKLTSRIDVPRNGADLDAGVVPIAGVAWSPSIGIAAVEVSVDDGPWKSARLGATANEDTWVQWVHEWDAVPGDHRIKVRCTGVDGKVQTGDTAPPAPSGATGWHTVGVRVR